MCIRDRSMGICTIPISPSKARSQISTLSWLTDQPFLNCNWRYYVKSAPYAVRGSTFLCYLIQLATGYCWSTVLYFALFGATLQSHFISSIGQRQAHCRCCMRHGRWLQYLEAATTQHRSSSPWMCELSSVQICNFVCYSLASIGTRHSFCFLLSIVLSLFIDALQLRCRASLARLSSVHCLSVRMYYS